MPYLTKSQLRAYEEDGFTIVDNIFDRDEIGAVEEAFRRIVRIFIDRAGQQDSNILSRIPPGEELDRGLIELAEHDRSCFDSVYDTIWMTPEFLRLVSKPQIQSCANELMASPESTPLYGYINRCRINLPSDERGTVDWHQEIFQTIPDTQFVQLWAPLVHDATREIGTIRLCVGSHKSRVPKPMWSENENGVSKTVFDAAVVDQFEQKSIELHRGQALFFSGRVLHRSGVNRSNKIRYSMVGIYHNIGDENFYPPKPSYAYRGPTPRDWFERLPSVY
ncbi:MAG: phytanoyl-CoA dioxygenase family protein [Alphaproteobacteria bacterium]|nr:phytanoyl-CoA dioxygenase family protein [Alphaproteobacteria bacterium]